MYFQHLLPSRVLDEWHERWTPQNLSWTLSNLTDESEETQVDLMNLAEQIWGNPKDWRPTYRVTHFSLYATSFFYGDIGVTLPQPTSPKLWTSLPAPGNATGNRARHPCSIPVDGVHKHPAFEHNRQGAKIIQLVKSSYQTTIGGSRPP